MKNDNAIVSDTKVQWDTLEGPASIFISFHLSFNVLGVNRGPTDNQSMNSEV